jgi:hypothetical protein
MTAASTSRKTAVPGTSFVVAPGSKRAVGRVEERGSDLLR